MKLRLSKAEVPKWTRVVDLRRTRGRRSVISEKSHSGRKRSVLNKNSRRPESRSSSESSCLLRTGVTDLPLRKIAISEEEAGGEFETPEARRAES
jgi:hypothetical protein